MSDDDSTRLVESRRTYEFMNSALLLMAERERAIKKHGWENTSENPDKSNEEKFIVLAEEFGEVARALTTDEGSLENLKAELVQVATTALLWRVSLEG